MSTRRSEPDPKSEIESVLGAMVFDEQWNLCYKLIFTSKSFKDRSLRNGRSRCAGVTGLRVKTSRSQSRNIVKS